MMKKDVGEENNLWGGHGMEGNNIWLPDSVEGNPREGIIVVLDMDGSSCTREWSENLQRYEIIFSSNLFNLLQLYGIPFTVATGRSSTSAMGVLKSTNVDKHMHLPMITEGGAALVSPQTQQVIHAELLSKKALSESYKLIDNIRDQIFSVSYYPIVQDNNAATIPGKTFSDHATFWVHERNGKADPQKLTRLYGAHYASHTSDLDTFFAQAEHDRVCQLRVHARDPDVSQSQTMKKALREACANHAAIHINPLVQGSIGHITLAKIGKKHGLEKLMNHIGNLTTIQNLTTIVYIGNDNNDLPIMQRDGEHPQIAELVKIGVGELMETLGYQNQIQLDYHATGPDTVHEVVEQAILDHIRGSSKRRMSG